MSCYQDMKLGSQSAPGTLYSVSQIAQGTLYLRSRSKYRVPRTLPRHQIKRTQSALAQLEHSVRVPRALQVPYFVSSYQSIPATRFIIWELLIWAIRWFQTLILTRKLPPGANRKCFTCLVPNIIYFVTKKYNICELDVKFTIYVESSMMRNTT